jgi:hypothetical protein
MCCSVSGLVCLVGVCEPTHCLTASSEPIRKTRRCAVTCPFPIHRDATLSLVRVPSGLTSLVNQSSKSVS